MSAAKSIPLLSERAYERVKHDIICCLIAPGTEVSEAQLCEQYKLGKAPVRMALSRLAHDGLVRAMPRRGYMVAPVTLKDIQDVFELRLLLEPRATRLAAGRVDAKRLRVLDEICRAGYQSGDPKSTVRFLEANKEFHVLIAQASGNARLAHAIAQLLDEMTRLLHLGLGFRNRTQEMQHEHRSLVRALVRGDGVTAEKICQEQIEAARDMVLKAILNSDAVMNLAIVAENH
ncbi:MAG: GntR family transcriptional regulator [Burkholderiales bacterium]|nr:GntR family transcriptional regulator [Burkholderiales bacterium]MDP2397686.1 GntR family transcriptional regulator [Burkholderiales bacterium]